MAFAKQVSGQFAGMRKPQNFTLYPARYDNGTTIQIQSSKCIGRLNPDTGAGIFYKGKGEHPGNVCLALAVPIQYPPDFVAAVKASHEATYGVKGTDGPIQIT